MSSSLRQALRERVASQAAARPTPVVVAIETSAGQRALQRPLCVALIGTLVCFVLLLAMRPPFVLRRHDPVRHAVLPAFLWSVLAGVVILAVPAVWSAATRPAAQPTVVVASSCAPAAAI